MHEPGIELECLTDRQSKPYEHERLLCGVTLPLLRDDSSTMAPKTHVATMLCPTTSRPLHRISLATFEPLWRRMSVAS